MSDDTPTAWKYRKGEFEPYDDRSQDDRKKSSVFEDTDFANEFSTYVLDGNEPPRYVVDMSLDGDRCEPVYFDTQTDLLQFLRDYLSVIEKFVRVGDRIESDVKGKPEPLEYETIREFLAGLSQGVREVVGSELLKDKKERERKRAEANKPETTDEELPDNLWDGI
jgi:hypothetical protein